LLIGGGIVAAFCSARNPKRDRSPLFEIANVLVHFDHVASLIVPGRVFVLIDFMDPDILGVRRRRR